MITQMEKYLPTRYLKKFVQKDVENQLEHPNEGQNKNDAPIGERKSVVL